MYKTTVKYEDFDGNNREETLYFALNKVEMIKLLREKPTIQDDLGKMAKRIAKNDKQDITLFIDFMDMVEDFIKRSYGVRTETGNFRKSQELLDDFLTSQAYDALYTKLLNNPNELDALLTGIFPADIMTDDLKKQIEVEQAKLIAEANKSE